MLRRRPRPCAVLAVGLALAVTACTSDSPEAGSPPSPSTGTSDSAAPSPSPSAAAAGPVEVRSAPYDSGTLELALHPLVRVPGAAGVGEVVVLTLDMTATEAPSDGNLNVGQMLADPNAGDGRLGEAGALRLLDLRNDTAHLLAVDGAGRGVATPQYLVWSVLELDEVARVQAVFAAPPADVEDVAVLVPRIGLVDALPVVDGPVPPPRAPDQAGAEDLEPLDVDSAVSAAVRPLEAYSEDLSGALRTESDETSTEVALAADVLFALDSADLTPAAAAALATAAGEVRAREPGPVSVVGHTDDQGEEAYNLDLSQRRAQSVAQALTPLLGPDYPLSVDGRGETDPAFEGTSSAARERNRRVDVTVTTPLSAAPLATREEQLPPAPELTATGAAGVVYASVDRWPYEIATSGARRVQGNLVVDLTITVGAAPTATARSVSPLALGTFRDPRDFSVTDGRDSARGMVALHGSTAVFPLFVPVGEDSEGPRLCACALNLGSPLVEGQTLVSSIVYPELELTGDLVLQNTPVTSADVGFRLTDIPVD